ncbi:gamma-glutamylcyclotransferase family protein, partial [Okeania sp. SIO2B9]|uniref:gamma-glutamylcyclotransferase family protein n=1 Tax=Okeania sp. SIO2B9 TaxID=2607782 RepID=UPI001428E4D5
MPSNAEQLFSSISNVKYFAYGSNLSKSLLEFKLASNLQTKDKYNTEPNSLILHSQPAILKNFEFKFNLYVPTNNVDPSYANLVYQKNSIVHGCLYEMSPECDLRRADSFGAITPIVSEPYMLLGLEFGLK